MPDLSLRLGIRTKQSDQLIWNEYEEDASRASVKRVPRGGYAEVALDYTDFVKKSIKIVAECTAPDLPGTRFDTFALIGMIVWQDRRFPENICRCTKMNTYANLQWNAPFRRTFSPPLER